LRYGLLSKRDVVHVVPDVTGSWAAVLPNLVAVHLPVPTARAVDDHAAIYIQTDEGVTGAVRAVQEGLAPERPHRPRDAVGHGLTAPKEREGSRRVRHTVTVARLEPALETVVTVFAGIVLGPLLPAEQRRPATARPIAQKHFTVFLGWNHGDYRWLHDAPLMMRLTVERSTPNSEASTPRSSDLRERM
jgi:hypothetical protein